MIVTCARVFVVGYLALSFLAVFRREARERRGPVTLLTTVAAYATFEAALCIAIWGRP